LITGVDHVVIAVRDLSAGVAAYETLLNTQAKPTSTEDGIAAALIGAVEVIAPVGEGAMAARLRAALDDGGEGLKSVAFATRDLGALHRRLERVGLAPEPIVERAALASFRLNTERTLGVRVFAVERAAPLAASDGGGLDHIVVRSRDMEQAAALYGARLGLELRLAREVAGRRLMFFRCGCAFVEIAYAPELERDMLVGLAWRHSRHGRLVHGCAC